MPTDVLGWMALGGLGLLAVNSLAGMFMSERDQPRWRRFLTESEEEKKQRKKNETRDGKVKPSVVLQVVKFFVCPLSAVSAVWGLASNVDAVLKVVPAVFKSYAGTSLVQAMPIHAKNILEAFELGQIYQSVTGGSASSALAEALKNATRIAGRVVTAEELKQLPEMLLQQLEHKGPVQRILGIFSFVNLIWFVSILGLAAFLLPFLWLVLSPLRRGLVTLWENVIWPTVLYLRPAYEPLFYIMSLFIMTESLRYPTDAYSMTGVMTAFTGLCGFFGSFCYTTYLHSTGGGDVQLWAAIAGAIFACAAGPMAVLHNSQLLGYTAVTALLTSLGFSPMGYSGCLCLGFRSGDAAARTAYVTLMLNLSFAAIRILDIPQPYLIPFTSAVTVYGSSLYFLTLLISSCVSSGRGDAWYIASIVTHIALGEFAGLDGMANVGKVYGALYGFTKFCEYCPKKNEAFVFSAFTFFGLLYWAAMYLNRNPQYIVAFVGQ